MSLYRKCGSVVNESLMNDDEDETKTSALLSMQPTDLNLVGPTFAASGKIVVLGHLHHTMLVGQYDRFQANLPKRLTLHYAALSIIFT